MPDALWQFAFREGGTMLVLLILLYFYRRDWMQSSEYWKQQNTLTTELVTSSVKATAELASAIRENTVVTHGLKRIVELSLLNPDHLHLTAEECTEAPETCPIKRRHRTELDLDRIREVDDATRPIAPTPRSRPR